VVVSSRGRARGSGTTWRFIHTSNKVGADRHGARPQPDPGNYWSVRWLHVPVLGRVRKRDCACSSQREPCHPSGALRRMTRTPMSYSHGVSHGSLGVRSPGRSVREPCAVRTTSAQNTEPRRLGRKATQSNPAVVRGRGDARRYYVVGYPSKPTSDSATKAASGSGFCRSFAV
jgi:hypothetical protein